MQIVPYETRYLADLTRLVNAHIELMPPGWTLNEAQVQAIVERPEQLWEAHYLNEEDEGPFVSQTVCAVENERLLAAVQWTSPGKGEVASLLWAIAGGDATEALAALLKAIVAQSQDEGYREVRTVRFGFSIGWGSVPDMWPHMTAAFEQAGYDRIEQWVLAQGDMDETPLTELTMPKLRLVWEPKPAAREWNLCAYDGDTLIGECQAWDPPPHFDDCDGYGMWTTVEWLGVEEPYRRRGLGRHLLAEQMRFQASRGVKHMLVWTETNNDATRRLNRTLGFMEGPTCAVFRHPLSAVSSSEVETKSTLYQEPT